MDQTSSSSRFLTFHTGRCGSTVLSHLLNKHAGVLNDGEIFEQSYKNALGKGSSLPPIEFLQERMAHAASRGKIYGCEVKLIRGTHLDTVGTTQAAAPQLFHDAGIDKFVLLHRRNHLDRIVSQLVAIERKSYVLRNGDDAEIPKFNLPLKQVRVGKGTYTLLDAIEMFDQDQNALRQGLEDAELPYIELVYEDDILNDPNTAVRKIADFIGFDFQPQPSELRKVVSKSKDEFILNFDEIHRTLENTPYAWMLS